MKVRKLLFLIIFICSYTLFGDVYKYSGTAFEQKTNAKVYTDNHIENRSQDKHLSSEIVYKDATGKVFAKKKINFEKRTSLPDFTLEDYRDGYMEGAKVSGTQIKLFFRETKDSPLQEKTFSVPPNAVVDGGFDFFVRENWESIAAGKKVTFSMFAPSKLNYYKFKVQKTKSGTYKGKEALYLRMELDSLIGVFLPAIDIVYGLENKRILFYEGISNINNAEGKSYFVKIQYEH